MSKSFLSDRSAIAVSLAAEFTSAAYLVLLCGGVGGSWVELELQLWKTLAEIVGKWTREFPLVGSPEEFTGWRDSLVTRLTDGAAFVAREQRVRQPLPQLRSGLHEAFSSAVSHARQPSSEHQVIRARNP
ncbi:MAG: hypothetical protein ACJ8F7_00315 [Gemmataceae bacterium]